MGEEFSLPGGSEVTGGSMQNTALVRTGDAAFGVTATGPTREALRGTNPIAAGLAMDEPCAIFPM